MEGPNSGGDPRAPGKTRRADWLAGWGVTRNHIISTDWSLTSLGRLDGWPAHLRVLVNLVVDSGQPMALCWGRELVLLHNEASRPFVANLHATALGRPIREIWPEHVSSFESVLTDGTSVCLEGRSRSSVTDAGLKEVVFNICCSPARTETGEVGGVLVTLHSRLERPFRPWFDGFRETFRDSGRFCAEALDSFPTVVTFKDLEGRFVEANKAVENVFRMPRERLYGLTDHDLFPEEEAELFRKNELEVMAAKRQRQREFSVELPGGPRHYLDTIFPLVGDDGGVYGVGHISQDVTELKRAQDEVREAYAIIQSITESTEDMIAAEDQDYRYLFFNDAYRREFKRRWGRDIQKGTSMPEVMAAFPDMQRKAKELWRRALDGESFSMIEEFNSSDVKQFYDLRFNPLRDEQGRVFGASHIFRNVTPTMRAQTRLRESEARQRETAKALVRANHEIRDSEAKFRSIFEQAAIGIGRVEFKEARWIDCNDAFCKMLGYIRAEILNTPWPDMTYPEDLDLDLIPFRRMAKGELDSYSVEKRFVHKEGHLVWARLTLSLVRKADGRPDYEVAIIEDITEQREAALALQEAFEQLRESDRQKDDFLAVLSHELRNPLAPIKYSTHIMEMVPPGGEQAKHALRVIDRQVDHLTRLIDDLLDVTRISRGKIRLQLEDLDLREVVRVVYEDLTSLFARQTVVCDLELPDEAVPVRGDHARLAQVVGNLLENAVKFSAEGGRVSVYLNVKNGDHAVLRVRDEGVGIQPELLEEIFEPFVQARESTARTGGGLGLGLALVKGLVELHHGRVSAHSEGEGRGAVFTVRLPIRLAESAENKPVRETRHGLSRRVLIIEDNLDAAESLRELLEIMGHVVDVAFDGADGIDKAVSIVPDVVICDLGLPKVDGYGVARALRAEPGLRSVLLVALSGYARPEDIELSRQAGFDRHLAKPPRIDELRELLSRVSASSA